MLHILGNLRSLSLSDLMSVSCWMLQSFIHVLYRCCVEFDSQQSVCYHSLSDDIVTETCNRGPLFCHHLLCFLFSLQEHLTILSAVTHCIYKLKEKTLVVMKHLKLRS